MDASNSRWVPAYFFAPLRLSSSTRKGQKPLGLALNDPVFTILIFMVGFPAEHSMNREGHVMWQPRIRDAAYFFAPLRLSSSTRKGQ